jgi:hypothetical protein
MAFKKISGYGKTVFFGEGKDAVKTFQFFPIDVKSVTSRKGENYCFITGVETDAANAETVNVQAHGQVVACLCDRDAEKNPTGIKSAYRGKLVRMTHLGLQGAGKKKFHAYDVEVDDAKKLVKYEIPPV